MKKQKGFSLIEIIVAIAIMAVLAGALVPVMFNQLDQARFTRVMDDLQAIYEASMGKPAENYFGFVGDVGRLPATTTELTDSTGMGSTWRGPYISLGGSMSLRDVYGSDYVIDQSPIQVRSFGPNKTDDSGLVDDMMYPQNALSTYKGLLEVQVYINGRLITDAAAEQVAADLAY
ncbi:MAG: prepilin-type N-terminal cleavage/methylation domain-containing protein, partial [Candidatus Glassbacteria bacterium]|nr:prepilin-type N-terminal cleavage/methylation domain-containing protein [Candidatus Glassbacteria bacterium]